MAGREVYIREGCYTCHSQMIRPMRDEVERYGHYSLAAESMYDHPFQWGSKRTGPDLARVGGRYSDEWHVDHLRDPQSVVPESVMPKYTASLSEKMIDGKYIGDHVGCTNAMLRHALYRRHAGKPPRLTLSAQADPDSDYDGLLERYGEERSACGTLMANPVISEADALIAYLQMLGTLVDFSTFTPGCKPLRRGRYGNLYTPAGNSQTAGCCLFLFVFFIGASIAWAFRPGSTKIYTRIQPAFPFRHV